MLKGLVRFLKGLDTLVCPKKNHSFSPSIISTFFNLSLKLNSFPGHSPAAKHNQVNAHHFGSLPKELIEPPLN